MHRVSPDGRPVAERLILTTPTALRRQRSSTASRSHPSRTRLIDELGQELLTLEKKQLRRRLTTIQALRGPVVTIDGRELVSWCSNDYLGFSTHPSVAGAAAAAAREWGVGARASRLLAGTTTWHDQLEASLARWFRTKRAIVYPSGYLANLGTLGALLSSYDVVLVDRLAHASLLDAARASPASFRVFRHNDVAHLKRLLSSAVKFRRRMVVTEGVFSMDGDQAPLAALADVAEAHDAMVYVDDAHGAFVCGASGRGSPEAAGVAHDRFLYMATLGKAIGCQGGFVVGPPALIDYLHNRARTFLYSTALAVPVAAAAVEALRVLEREPQWRQLLHERIARLYRQLTAFRLIRSARASHILPVVVGEPRRALRLAQKLWDRGMWAPAIRPPTVPIGTARLRLSVTALHTEAQIDALTAALRYLVPRIRRVPPNDA